jgi:hypothetical protein
MGNCYKVNYQIPIFCFQGGPIWPCFGATKPKNGVWWTINHIGGGLSSVSAPQNPKFSPIWVEKRLRNGSGMAGETAEFRSRSRPALLREVITDRGELYCHRTRHRGDVRAVAFRVGAEPSGHRAWY